MNTTTVTKALALAALASGAVTLLGATAAHAEATASVYARHGVIYLHDGTGTTRLTGDEVSSQPRLAPDGTLITYIHNNTVWVMHTDGTEQHQVSDRTATAPVWTPDSSRIDYTATSCTGAPGTFRTRTTGGTTSEVLLPAACRDQDLPQTGYING